jgi:hypothetical protein
MKFTAAQSTLDKNRGTIKNRQFRDTGTGDIGRRQTIQKITHQTEKNEQYSR